MTYANEKTNTPAPAPAIGEVAAQLSAANGVAEVKIYAGNEFPGLTLLGFTLGRGLWHWFEYTTNSEGDHFYRFHHSYNQHTGVAQKGFTRGLKVKGTLERLLGYWL